MVLGLLGVPMFAMTRLAMGETLQPATLFFSLAVIAAVFVGRKMPVGHA